MIFSKVILKDVGLFNGVQEVDLKPTTKSKPLILIGGENGAGKTTFFDSIKVCLYGKQSLGTNISNPDYEKYLQELINHDSKENNAFVELWIEYNNVESVDVYKIRRSWGLINNQNFSEELKVTKNDSNLNDVEFENWQEFINEIIPIGVSQLFFFDGEKIQNLAKNEEGDLELRDSFFKMLNLDIIERLRGDLEIYESRLLRDMSTNGSKNFLIDLEESIKKAELKVESTRQHLAQKKSICEKINYDILREEQRLSAEGGMFAEKRTAKKEELSKTELKIAQIESELRELSLSILPFVFSKNLGQRLLFTLKEENAVNKKKSAKALLEEEIKKLKSSNSEISKEIGIDKEKLNILYPLLIQKIFPNLDTETKNKLHDISEKDYANILYWSNESKTAEETLTSIHKELTRLILIRNEINVQLVKAPEKDVLSPIIKNINDLNQNKGATENELKNIEEALKSAEFQLLTLKRNLEKELSRLEDINKGSRKVELLKKSKLALETYSTELKKTKAHEFSKLVSELFGFLLRKNDLFSMVKVNPIDFSVRFYKSENKPIPKKQLSAGEKQMFSIAVLWALSKLSGKHLPFIIDTPLARLDVSHRDNLINKFFPNAGSQIIILSTDSEVDEKYYVRLSKSMSKAYTFNYSNEKTKIKEGYFW